MAGLRGKDLLTLEEFTTDEIETILAEGAEFKRMQARGMPHRYLEGRTIALLFDKPSMRTRVSFEVGFDQLGGKSVYLGREEVQSGLREDIKDIGQVLSRFIDVIAFRTFEQKIVEDLAKSASVPVINALTDEHHPCQALADLMTIIEHKGHLEGLQLAYIGDGNNVCHSLIIACSKVGIDMRIATPQGYEPKSKIVNIGLKNMKKFCGKIELSNNPQEAAKDADVVYTDVWVSMGQEGESKHRVQDFQGFKVDQKLMALADREAIFMHCLPAHRGMEVDQSVIDGQRSVVYDQAENRLHSTKALLYLILEGVN